MRYKTMLYVFILLNSQQGALTRGGLNTIIPNITEITELHISCEVRVKLLAVLSPNRITFWSHRAIWKGKVRVRSEGKHAIIQAPRLSLAADRA